VTVDITSHTLDFRGRAAVLVVVHDVTARKEAEEQLRRLTAELESRVEQRTVELDAARSEAERANQAKSEFLSRMSHELRTPLNAILGFAQVLQLDGLSGEQAESVTHILRGGKYLLLLINEVLDVARIESGSLTLSLEPIAIAGSVGDAVTLIRPLAAERGIAFDVAPIPESMTVKADRQRLSEILVNLLSNAVKYNRERGRVGVTAQRMTGDRIRVSVTDTGAGIPADKLARLFTPFERLGAEGSGIEGTGLGLALARGFAQAMHGSVSVESVIDQGCSFHLELPAADPIALPVVSPVAADDAAARAHGVIVYIEDNVSNVRLMEQVVKRRPGVELLCAGDGRSGVTMVREHRPQLVFLDLHLPDISGEEVLREIWEYPATREIPVVVLSADAMPAQQQRLLASGAAAYLTKPFDIAAVLEAIDRALGA
jgi:signal transduction histidine kinase/CheY-like chemotaxis protein